MQLTRIDPADFVFNNDAISTSCWRDANGNPVGNTGATPSWEIQNVSYQVNSSTGQLANYYIGNPANIQFSWTSLPSSYARKTGNPFQRALYGALRNIIVGDANADITWGGNAQSIISIISISKNCLKSSLLPGSFRIGNLTDDSNENPPQILNCGRAYTLVQGSTIPGEGFTYGRGDGTFGLFLPDVGLIIGNIAFTPTTFVLSTENLTPTNHVFIRARNNQYNYSMNPSFISRNSGLIINQDWYSNPQTYITTVGLYNDDNELMATAKLPKPYNKNFNNELLMQIGLNF